MQFGGAPEVRRHTADRIDRIWGLYNEAVVAGDSSGYVLSRYKENSGRKGYDRTALVEEIFTSYDKLILY
ncbi:hypothetical protein PR002_g7208 [Phytophthora rubi]|uniref:Uncharacterized protein n=1 Tax=Phytophthora rubi TaxID=129364 RepID=A0A6A3MSV1_9STRA|nr:hypothetical protein PR002_g7208 [Phytophthora rubi]